MQHRVGNRTMTTFEAAQMLGISHCLIQQYMRRRKATLAKTIKYYQTKQKRKAEKDILSILGF